ncbi:pilus assembly protein TadG-related protein [Qipengyuania sp.]|uniref:pilus assembly protein TadG-related protein n=1 Tax=Qipengyuania sp. TaxID=2004515 RepID=UPI0035C7DBC0
MANSGIRAALRALFREAAGNILPMTAAAIFVLAGLIGGGVDMSRAYLVKNRLQSACDAGVLAGRKAVTTAGFDAAARNQATTFFNTNFDSNAMGVSGTTFVPVSSDSGNTIDGTASTVLPMSIMKIFSFETMPLSVSCQGSMSVGNSDVMFVLDTTGSMASNINSTDTTVRMAALRSSMKSFYDTVAAATAGSNARVRFGFVPYSTNVKVGALIRAVNPDYIANTVTLPSRQAQKFSHYASPVYASGTSPINLGYGDYYYYDSVRYYSNSSCQSASPANTDWTDYNSATSGDDTYINADGDRIREVWTSQPQYRLYYTCLKQSGSKYYIIYRYEVRDEKDWETWTEEAIYVASNAAEATRFGYLNLTYNVTSFKNGGTLTTLTGYNSSSTPAYRNQNWTWNGCIIERDTVASGSISFVSGSISPSGMYDVDIDYIPNSDATRWRVHIPGLAYRRYTNGYLNSLSTEDYSQYGNGVTGTCVSKAARALAPMNESDFDAYVDSLPTSGNTYHDIGMIWGARMISQDGIFAATVNQPPANGNSVARHIVFMTDGVMDTNNEQYNAWGLEWHERRVTDDGGTDEVARHTQRLLAACAAAKAKGIRVWVIALSTGLTTDLQNCASTNSAFTASDSSQLNAHFQEIAKNVGELRITQ